MNLKLIFFQHNVLQSLIPKSIEAEKSNVQYIIQGILCVVSFCIFYTVSKIWGIKSLVNTNTFL